MDDRDRRARLDTYFSLLAEHPWLARNDGAALRVVLDRAELERYEDETGERLGILAQDGYLIFVHDLVEAVNGRRFVYVRVVNPKSLKSGLGAVILAVERRPEGDRIAFIRTYRHSLRSWVLELPRGSPEPGMSTFDNARRELAEETGLEALSIKQLGIVEPDSGFLSSPAGVFLAEVSADRAAAPSPEAGEAIAGVVWLSIHAVQARVADGRIQDGFTAAAIGLAVLRGALRIGR